MSNNYPHYNVDKLEPKLKVLVESRKLTEPCFIGQGLSNRVGSDCYGFYIVDKRQFDKHIIWGITHAKQVMHGDWTEGDMDCSIDIDNATPTSWIMKWRGKWWFCDELGNRYINEKCKFGWNGAYGYRDPSF